MPKSWKNAASPILLFLFAAAIVCATAGGPGLAWDEPTYRNSQVGIQDWLDELWKTNDPSLLRKSAIDQFWNSNRIGPNFHPPMGGYLNLVAFWTFGPWLDDILARRLASSLEFAVVVAVLSGFIGNRFGRPAGWFAGLSLLFLPRVVGDAHVVGTDMPLLFFWALSALAFWNAFDSRRWQWITAALLAGLFLVKFNGAMILLPLLLWLAPSILQRPTILATWIRWSLPIMGPTLLALALLVASMEVAVGKRPPNLLQAFFFSNQWLAIVVLLWPGLALGLFHRFRRRSLPDWDAALEIPWVAAAATPLLAVTLNPVWWHETFRGLASYLQLQLHRSGTHPDIAIYFLGAKFGNTLPWPNAYILMAVTIPWGVLFIGAIGVGLAVRQIGRRTVETYFLLHALTLPVIRMFPTPAHDGVRLFLPTFFFWAGLAGIAAAWIARGRVWKWMLLFAIGPGWAAADWIRTHPYELSYYNVGLPTAVARGFETTYWYDAVTPQVLEDLNNGPHRLPDGIPIIGHLDQGTNTETFLYLQKFGKLRQDLVLDPKPITCKTWAFLLSHSSKSTALKRLLYACEPWYESRFQGVRVFSVVEPRALNVATVLMCLTIEQGHTSEVGPLRLFAPAFEAGRDDYAKALAAYRRKGPTPEPDSLPAALLVFWTTHPVAATVLPQVEREDPDAVERAIQIISTRPADVRKVILTLGYKPVGDFGGYFKIR